MKIKFLKIVSMAIALIMILGSVATGLFTNSFSIIANAQTAGTCGDNVAWSFNESSGKLTISGSGDMKNYESTYSVPWDSFRSDIKSISFSNQITNIGSYSFSDCAITSVSLPEKLKTISICAFENCSALKEVIFSSNVQKIGNWAFKSCEELNNIVIPEEVTYIGVGSFEDCTSLADITLPDTVEIIDENALTNTAYCKNIFNFDEGVLYINNHIISVNIEEISSDFVVRDGIKSIAAKAFEMADIERVVIADSVVGIGAGAFWGCNNLVEIKMGASVKYVDSNAFSRCEELESVIFYPGLLKLGSFVFEQCDNLDFVHIPESVIYIGSNLLGGGVRADLCAISTDSYANEYASSNSFDSFVLCDGHGVEEIESDSDNPIVPPNENDTKYDSRLIKEPSRTTIKYDDAIVLHADEYFIPRDGRVEWTADNTNFSMIVSLDTKTCTIASKNDGKTTFTATVYDKNGKAIYIDTQTMDSNASFFQRILGFFRALFGLDKLYEY